MIILTDEDVASEIHLISKNGFKDDVQEFMTNRGMLGVGFSYALWQVDEIPKDGKMTRDKLKKHGKMMIMGIYPTGWKRKYPKFNSLEE